MSWRGQPQRDAARHRHAEMMPRQDREDVRRARRSIPFWDPLTRHYDVDHSGDELILTCRRCGEQLAFSQSYHASALAVAARRHLTRCRQAHAPDP